MKFFRFDIGARARKASRFLGDVRHECLRALIEEKSKGLSQQELADRLEIPRSQLNSQLTGSSNLSLRALSDLAWALDREIVFELRPRAVRAGQNTSCEASTLDPGRCNLNRGYMSASTNANQPPIKIIRTPSQK